MYQSGFCSSDTVLKKLLGLRRLVFLVHGSAPMGVGMSSASRCRLRGRFWLCSHISHPAHTIVQADSRSTRGHAKLDSTFKAPAYVFAGAPLANTAHSQAQHQWGRNMVCLLPWETMQRGQSVGMGPSSTGETEELDTTIQSTSTRKRTIHPPRSK